MKSKLDSLDNPQSNYLFNILLSILCVILLLAPVHFIQIECSLDYSWMTAINLAVKNNMVFGKDFVFTYGPFGYLCTRLPLDLTIHHFIYIDIFNYLIFGYITYFFLSSSRLWLKYFVVTIPILFIKNYISFYWSLPSFYFWEVIMLMSIFLINKKRIEILFIIPTIVSIGFLCKLNFGIVFLVILFMFYGYVILTWERKNIRWIILSMLFFGTIMFVLTQLVFKVELINYFISTLVVIDSYNDAMYAVPEALTYQTYALDLVIILLYCISAGTQLYFDYIKQGNAKNYNYFVVLVTLLAFFVSFKHTVVRAHIDEFHKVGFFLFAPLLLGKIGPKSKTVFIACFTLTVLISVHFYFFIETAAFKKNSMLEDLSISKKFTALGKYNAHFKRGQNIKVSTSCVFPNSEALTEIQNNSVDIFPFEITTMKLYGFKYNPRPVIQSYQVVDPFLDKLNQEKLSSQTKPSYIMMNLFGLDGRNPLHEETYSKLAILSNYSVSGINFSDAYGNVTLHKKRENAIPFEIKSLEKSTISFNDTFTIPQSEEILLLKTSLKFSLAGKIKRTLFVTTPIMIKLILEDGSIREHRLILPISNGGIIINKYIDYFGQAAERDAFFKFAGKYNKKVTKAIITTTEEWALEKTFEIEYLKVNYTSEALDKPLEYTEIPQIPEISNNFQGGLEYLDSTNTSFIIKGWLNKVPSTFCCNKISLILKSDKRTILIPAHLTKRYDIVQQLQTDLNHSDLGFNVMAIKEFLPKGKYQIYLPAISDNSNLSATPLNRTYTVE